VRGKKKEEGRLEGTTSFREDNTSEQEKGEAGVD
jgi:hypothetical protein